VNSELARTIEALLFLSSDPLSVEELAEATESSGERHRRRDRRAARRLRAGSARPAAARGRGRLHAGERSARRGRRARAARPPRHSALTPAQLETLAIVAYLQPVSRPEIARIRGVNAESPVATLLDRSLIAKAVARSSAPSSTARRRSSSRSSTSARSTICPTRRSGTPAPRSRASSATACSPPATPAPARRPNNAHWVAP
jgi:chromosome segregation and condensation protein ScpB